VDEWLLFKTDQQRKEFYDFTVLDPRVAAVVMAGAVFAHNNGLPPLVVTGVARYEGRDDSPHKIIKGIRDLALACDIRAHYQYFTLDQERLLLEFWRHNFPRYDMMKWEKKIAGWYGTVRVHGEEAERHIHLALPPLADQLRATAFSV
jgi:hypothetical protein